MPWRFFRDGLRPLAGRSLRSGRLRHAPRTAWRRLVILFDVLRGLTAHRADDSAENCAADPEADPAATETTAAVAAAPPVAAVPPGRSAILRIGGKRCQDEGRAQSRPRDQ
ncbi:hypothetical protein GCM10007884_16290 [Methylobacterium brachythecii]|uniref:Uncharacterized protein n=1 Tax=Methylobacterium brachythecii TaxID=1176177 RepID=A0ABQ6CZY7_9HYPH|nr:hypothetical protein GCM10007884_16290 [Methylobacterium brachythecii]